MFVGLLVLAMHIPLPNKGTILKNDIKNHYILSAMLLEVLIDLWGVCSSVYKQIGFS